MNSGVAKRVIKGLSANGYGQLVTVIVQLVGVPVLLYTWGPQLYGEWLVLFAIPAYLSIADLGFSQSVANDMTARAARGDRVGALAAFQSLAVLVYSIVAAGLLLSAVVLWRVPLDGFLNFEVIGSDEARWVLWLLIAKVLVALADGVNHAGFRAVGEYALHQSLQVTGRLLQFIGIWGVALVGGGPVLAALAFFGVGAITTVTLGALLKRRHAWLSFGFAHAQRAELRRLARPALGNVAIPLAQALNVQGMVLVVAAALGPLAVVVFSTLRTLTRMTLGAIMAVAHATEPELAAAYGAGNHALVRTLFVHGLRASAWLGLATAVVLLLFGRSVLEIWTHGQVSMDFTLFAWLIASALASVLWFGALVVLKATNKHMGAALLYLVSSAAVVGLAALLLEWTGELATTGIALLVMDTAMILYTLSVARRVLESPLLTSVALAANPLPLLRAVARLTSS